MNRRDYTTTQLIDRGWAVAPSLLSPTEVSAVAKAVTELMDAPAADYEKHRADAIGAYQFTRFVNKHWTVLGDVVGASPTIDAALEKIVTDPRITQVLEATMGPGYKLWQATVRRNEPGGDGLVMHQDTDGGVSMSILLADVHDVAGTTVFLPGSHRWPLTISDCSVTLQPKHVLAVADGAVGRGGDAFFWFNRIWHGRAAGPQPALALMLSFHAVGYPYPESTTHFAPREVLDRLGPTLRGLMDRDIGLQHEPSGRVRVVGDGVTPVRDADVEQILSGKFPVGLVSRWGVASVLASGVRRVKKRIREVRAAL